MHTSTARGFFNNPITLIYILLGFLSTTIPLRAYSNIENQSKLYQEVIQLRETRNNIRAVNFHYTALNYASADFILKGDFNSLIVYNKNLERLNYWTEEARKSLKKNDNSYYEFIAIEPLIKRSLDNSKLIIKTYDEKGKVPATGLARQRNTFSNWIVVSDNLSALSLKLENRTIEKEKLELATRKNQEQSFMILFIANILVLCGSYIFINRTVSATPTPPDES